MTAYRSIEKIIYFYPSILQGVCGQSPKEMYDYPKHTASLDGQSRKEHTPLVCLVIVSYSIYYTTAWMMSRGYFKIVLKYCLTKNSL